MWKRRCACRNAHADSGRAGWLHSLFLHTRSTPALILVVVLCLLPAPAAAEQLVCKVVLNQEYKGDLFVDRTELGDFLVKVDDLKEIGFRSPRGTSSLHDGEEYLSLRSMDGVTFAFDEGDLSLAITAAPALLGKEVIDFFPRQRQKIYYPHDASVFLNYGADYQAGDGFSFSSFNLTNQLGARKGNLLFLTDTDVSKVPDHERFVRLQSSFTYDDRRGLRRFIVGDYFTPSGDLGSRLNLGGISYAKVYGIDPYFINYPTVGLTGQVALPSEAKIYLNGMLTKTVKLSPGEFELDNITPSGAAGVIDIVLKDPFGRERHIRNPYYFGGASLLKQGLSEYSYNLGFLRAQFGTDSNHYSDLAFSAFHRFGVSDFLTLGVRAEARRELYNLGPQATFLLGTAGLVNLSLAGSTGRSSDTGGAGIVSYVYQGLHAGANLSLAGFSRRYANIATAPSSAAPRTQASAGLSYTDRLLGSLSVGYSTSRTYGGDNRDVASVSYFRNLTNACSITATFRNVKDTGTSNEFFLALNYSPKVDTFVSAGYQTAKDSNDATLEVQKNPPVGEGLGYRVVLDRSDTAGQTVSTANPSLQYNGRYGIYQGEFNGQVSAGHYAGYYHLSTSGALVYVGHTFGVTRPVYDSFGLVKVGDLHGVNVLLNGQEVGSTDSSGKLFIPNLGSYYQSQVAIDDKHIPIDYYLANVVKLVSPPLRSGSCIPFVAKKMQMISGTLKMRIHGKIKPVEFQEVTIAVNGREITFPTGSGGEFDIDPSQSDELKKPTEAEENGCNAVVDGATPFIPPGTYRGTVAYQGQPQSFAVTIPDRPDQIIDLGQIVFDMAPSTGNEPQGTPVPERR